MHEASLHDANCFLTLTYTDEHIPSDGSLIKRHFQLFMKRLRKAYTGTRIRFFAAGEYGAESGRPHYHALIFGFDFPDKVFLSRRGDHKVYRSASLEKIWGKGLAEIGSVTFESAQYCAGYILKKVTGDLAEEYYQGLDLASGEITQLLPEFGLMSQRPGIGREWIEKYHEEVYRHDSVIVRGRKVKPGHYYDRFMTDMDEALMVDVKKKRRRGVDSEEQTPERLGVRERCKIAKAHFFAKESI